ncbi:MAG: hypothetical protein EBX03_15390, partial [Rhodobacteraceae bacterium]|nr:hypothetical protein [Paracoccaceae bacterium]
REQIKNLQIKTLYLAANLLAERQYFFFQRFNFHWGHISTAGGHMSALSALLSPTFNIDTIA